MNGLFFRGGGTKFMLDNDKKEMLFLLFMGKQTGGNEQGIQIK